MAKVARTDDRMCVLTDSSQSAIRWRLCDYEAMLRTELQILAAQEHAEWRSPRRNGRNGEHLLHLE
jgi:hypothetical protein